MTADDTTAAPPGRTFQLGRRDLSMLVGFVLTVVLADRALDASPYDVVLPQEHGQNQIHLLAHRKRPEPVDVLIVGSSRVEAGIHPAVIASVISSPEHAPTVARLPVMGLHAIALLQVTRELIVPQPPRELLVIGLEERYFFRLHQETDDQLGLRLMGTGRDLALVPPWLLRSHDLPAFFAVPFRGVRAVWQLGFVWDDSVPAYLEHMWATGGLPEYPRLEFSRRDLALARGLAAASQRRRNGGRLELLPAELHAFDRTLDLLESLPCRVVFVRMPVARSFEEDYAAEYAAYRDRVVEDVTRRGFLHADLNRIAILRLDPLLQNPSHLNPTGRIVASKALALALIAPTLFGERTSPALAAARSEMVATEGLSLRPAPDALPPEVHAWLEAAVREEAAFRRRADAESAR